MGANKTQAQGVALFLVAFVLIAAGLAAAYSVIALVCQGLVVLGSSDGDFRQVQTLGAFRGK